MKIMVSNILIHTEHAPGIVTKISTKSKVDKTAKLTRKHKANNETLRIHKHVVKVAPTPLLHFTPIHSNPPPIVCHSQSSR